LRTALCDIHVHSSHSRETSLWILRSLKVPESLTPPELVYEKAMERGMDFVTITDINTIDGVMSISHHDNVFVSEEVCVRIPGRDAILHLLVFGIDPSQHEEISGLRDDFHALMDYLDEQGIAAALAHPFHFPGAPLTARDFRTVLQRISLVETVNGNRSRVENEAVRGVVRSLDPDMGFVGGSDDHCGRFLGLTHTGVKGADTVEAYLEGVRRGEGLPGGHHGSAIRGAYSVYSIAYSFYRDRMLSKKVPRMTTEAADRFFRPGPSSESEPTLWHRADGVLHRVLGRAVAGSELEEFVNDQLLEIGKDLWINSSDLGGTIDERTFEIMNNLTNRFARRFITMMASRMEKGRILEALEAVTALAPLLMLSAPYPLFYFISRRGRDAVRRISRELTGEELGRLDSGKRAWFTDTIDDLNGVSRTLQRYSGLALETGRELAVLSCQSRPVSFPGWVVNFKPIKEFPIPDYSSKTLSIPPFLEMLRFVEEQGLGMLYISTPGPVGLVALGIGKLLGIPCVGIHHTDFARHVNQIVQDARMGEMAGSYTGWFMGAMDRVLVPSTYYMDDLEQQGVPREKMRLFPRGIDSGRFSPGHRDPDFFGRFGGSPDSFKLVYVGRVSREKDLDVLGESLRMLRERGRDVELFVVGDGPYLGEMVRELTGSGAYFTGILKGEELYAAYASGDLFVFPSTTDTYGNVVLEAHSSGLPAVVTDMGGPREIIEPERTGIIVRGKDPGELAGGIQRLMDDPERLREMSKAARELAEGRSWRAAFDATWTTQVEDILD
jgi:glycosyltransferase involved in cell wall biosynthesis/predicted metal-dependent phosphoesterase TrpH